MEELLNCDLNDKPKLSVNCDLDDKYELSAHNIESCIVTGREICRAAGLRESNEMLYMQLTSFGFSGVKVEKVK